MGPNVKYHIESEMEWNELSIYDSVTYKFTDIHVFIPHTKSGYLTTPLGLDVDYIKCTQMTHHQS
jgi:hypothetical protein